MDAEDEQEAFSDLGLSSIASGSPAEVPADGSSNAFSNAADGFVAPVAEPASNNPVATNTNNTESGVATAIVTTDSANQPARHTTQLCKQADNLVAGNLPADESQHAGIPSVRVAAIGDTATTYIIRFFLMLRTTRPVAEAEAYLLAKTTKRNNL